MEHGGVGGAGVGVSVGQPGVERGARGESEARPRGVERDALEVGGAEGVAVEGRRGGRSGRLCPPPPPKHQAAIITQLAGE